MVGISKAPAVVLQLLVLASFVAASPLPLNINLGAYSPAIVVGDGDIAFDGTKEGTSNSIVNALQSSGTTVGESAPPAAEASGPAESNSGVKIVQAAPDPSILTEPASLPVPGSKELDPRV